VTDSEVTVSIFFAPRCTMPAVAGLDANPSRNDLDSETVRLQLLLCTLYLVARIVN
jgi:hypothetical protein